MLDSALLSGETVRRTVDQKRKQVGVSNQCVMPAIHTTAISGRGECCRTRGSWEGLLMPMMTIIHVFSHVVSLTRPCDIQYTYRSFICQMGWTIYGTAHPAMLTTKYTPSSGTAFFISVPAWWACSQFPTHAFGLSHSVYYYTSLLLQYAPLHTLLWSHARCLSSGTHH